MSQNLVGPHIEWSKQIWGNHGSTDDLAERCDKALASNAHKFQSNERVGNDKVCRKSENHKKAEIGSDEKVQCLAENLSKLTTMEIDLEKSAEDIQEFCHHVDVLILGAGLAGLGAATAISKGTNLSYLLLEAQRQAGGRVKTEPMLEFSTSQKIHAPSVSGAVDLGAQWLHGRNNFLYTISENNKLLASEQSEEGLGAFFYEDSSQIDEYLAKKVDFCIGQILNECEAFARRTKDETYPKSVGHFLRERFQTFLDNLDNEQDREHAKNLFDWHVRFQIIDNSCLSLDQLSAKYWGKYSFNGESCQAHYNFKNGFGSVIDCLIGELIYDSVHYNKEVTSIRIHENQTEMNNNSTSSKRPNISVKCSDGTCYTANHVLVTFSLGVLKKMHEKLFSPSLPRQVHTAIESIGFETINKIFLEFDCDWWRDLDGIQFLFNANEEKKSWTHHLTGFDILHPHSSHILLGWVGGAGAIQMEKLSDHQIIKDCVNFLTKFTNINVPYPTRFYCTRWHSNAFVSGAYSYISTKCDNNETISKNVLNQPLTLDDFRKTPPKPRQSPRSPANAPVVLFAGEACHCQYFSTAHGAFLSGKEQAQTIFEFYK